jgi:hypothetical protein
VIDSSLAILYSPKSGEFDVAATRQRLMQIAEKLDVGNGEVGAVDLPDASPFETCLLSLKTRRLPSGGAIFRVDPGKRELSIEGGEDALRLLGDNLRDLATDGDDGEHLHIEYFPDHSYLDESSLPAVVQVVPG